MAEKWRINSIYSARFHSSCSLVKNRLLLAYCLSVGLHRHHSLIRRNLSAWSIPRWIMAKKDERKKKTKKKSFWWKIQMGKLWVATIAGEKKGTRKSTPSHSFLSRYTQWNVYRELKGAREALKFKRLEKTTKINLVFISFSSICIPALNLASGITSLLCWRRLQSGARRTALKKHIDCWKILVAVGCWQESGIKQDRPSLIKWLQMQWKIGKILSGKELNTQLLVEVVRTSLEERIGRGKEGALGLHFVFRDMRMRTNVFKLGTRDDTEHLLASSGCFFPGILLLMPFPDIGNSTRLCPTEVQGEEIFSYACWFFPPLL